MRTALAVTCVAANLCLAGCGEREGRAATEAAAATPKAMGSNRSTPTLCAEQDNVNIPLTGAVKSFTIEATHPTYAVGNDNCAPDFANCPDDPGPTYSFTPQVYKLLDDGETVVEAVREATWWRPTGMTAQVDDGRRVFTIHYLRVYRKIAGAAEWPQVLVLYMDGNLRLIPQPPVGRASVCFGSSVVVGPAAIAERPIAAIRSVRYRSSLRTLEVAYREGGAATLRLGTIDRQRALVTVKVNYPTDAKPFATFRSMYVKDGNADVDHVQWRDVAGKLRDSKVLRFPGGESSAWFFHRATRSQHNTSAPDIRIALVR